MSGSAETYRILTNFRGPSVQPACSLLLMEAICLLITRSSLNSSSIFRLTIFTKNEGIVKCMTAIWRNEFSAESSRVLHFLHTSPLCWSPPDGQPGTLVVMVGLSVLQPRATCVACLPRWEGNTATIRLSMNGGHFCPGSPQVFNGLGVDNRHCGSRKRTRADVLRVLGT